MPLSSSKFGHILTTALLLFRENLKDHLIFAKYVIWATVDFFSGRVAMVLIMILCIFTSYVGFSRKKEKKWYKILSLLFNMWPIAEGLTLWLLLGRKKVGHDLYSELGRDDVECVASDV